MTLDVPSRPPKFRTRIGRSSTRPPQEAPHPTPPPPRLPARRNPRWIALGLVALCLGGLLSYVIYSRVATESAVVSMAATVYRGQTITAEQLTTVTVHGESPLNTVPAEQLEDLVGRQAVYDLVEGSLVPSGAIRAVTVPARGRAVVGVKLAQGRAPSNLLNPGSPVRLVALPPSGETGGAAKDALTDRNFLGRVVDAAPAADGAATLVNVDVPANQGPIVARLSAQDRIALLRDADR